MSIHEKTVVSCRLFPCPPKYLCPPIFKKKMGGLQGGGNIMLIYLDNTNRWDILTANLIISTTLMRTSTRTRFLREPAERWKAGGSPGVEWTSESQGERESRSLCRNRHRYRARGFSKILRSPQ
jgi:hypothetical protein